MVRASGECAAGGWPPNLSTAARHTAKSHELDADRRLIPSGPTGVLLCRYYGLNPSDRYQRLDATRLVTKKATVRALMRRLNASTPFPDGTFFCPRDDEPKAVGFFRYADGREMPITVGLMGCLPVSNARLAMKATWNTVQLIKRVTRG